MHPPLPVRHAICTQGVPYRNAGTLGGCVAWEVCTGGGATGSLRGGTLAAGAAAAASSSLSLLLLGTCHNSTISTIEVTAGCLSAAASSHLSLLLPEPYPPSPSAPASAAFAS